MRSVVLFFFLCGAFDYAFAEDRRSKPATLFDWDGEPDPLGELPTTIITERPSFTESSVTVGQRVTQIETGYTFASVTGTQTQSWGELLLRQGVLANWLELRFGVFPLSEDAESFESGIADLLLGTKLALTSQSGLLPELALIMHMTVPTGSTSFTANRVLPGFNLLYGWDVTETAWIAGGTSCNVLVNDDTFVASDTWATSMSLGDQITDRLGYFGEWFAIVPDDPAEKSVLNHVDGGLVYLLTDDIQWDVRIGKGLSQNSDDYFVGTGMGIRFR
jgi:hypothetical protein